MKDIIKKLEDILLQIQEEEERDIYYVSMIEQMGQAINDIDHLTNKAKSSGETDMAKISKSIFTNFCADPKAFANMSESDKVALIERCTHIVKKQNMDRTKTITLLKGLIYYLNLEEAQIFLEFKKLAFLFQNIKISPSDQLNILSNIIKINATLNNKSPEEKVYVPDAEAIMDYDYQYMNRDELYNIFSENRFDEFLKDESYPNKLGKREVERRNEETKRDFTELQHACNKLDVIFQKETKDTTDEDCEIIKECMSTIYFGNLAYRIIKMLKKGIQEEERKSAKEEVKETKVLSSTPKYSQRKINQVYYEISKLYDLEHFKEKTVLSLDEIIYLLSLMYSIEMDDKTIKKFLNSAMHSYNKNNPFCIFYQSYDKFKSFDDPNIEEHLEMIEYILSDVNIFICEDEVYEETKVLVSDELDEIMNILSGNYTYEINKAKSLLKNNEEGDKNARNN